MRVAIISSTPIATRNVWARTPVALAGVALIASAGSCMPNTSDEGEVAETSLYGVVSRDHISSDVPPDVVLQASADSLAQPPEESAWRWARSYGQMQLFVAPSGTSTCLAAQDESDDTVVASCKEDRAEGYLGVRIQGPGSSSAAPLDITVLLVPDDIAYAEVGNTRCRAAENIILIWAADPEGGDIALTTTSGELRDGEVPPSAPDSERPSTLQGCG